MHVNEILELSYVCRVKIRFFRSFVQINKQGNGDKQKSLQLRYFIVFQRVEREKYVLFIITIPLE